MKILVVDDEIKVREMLSEMISRFGYECRTAANGEEALNILKNDPLPIVISDIRMPGIDGMALLKEIKKEHSEIDVISMTAFSEEYTFTDVVKAGASDFILKPFSKDEIEAKLSRIIRERELREKHQLTEEKLKEAKDFLENVIDAAMDGIIINDEKGNIISVNNALEHISGRRREELIGKHCSMLVPKEEREHRKTVLEKIGEMLERGGISFESFFELPDGNRVEVECRSSMIKNDGGDYFAGVSILRDITERKRTKKTLEETNRQLEQAIEKAHQMAIAAESANMAKSEFLANMSHEIRTPMNGVIGFTDMLLETEMNPEQIDYALTIKHSAENLLSIINNVLDFSKIETKKLEPETIDFSLRDGLHDMIKLFTPRSQEKGLELVLNVLPEVPDALVGDPGLLRQIVINLVGNAIKFTAQGKIMVQVEEDSQLEDDICLHFSVIDTGIGIPADKQQVIFEAFAQADGSTTREYGGTGLGLAISSKLVEVMGGKIWVESPANCGMRNGEFGTENNKSETSNPQSAISNLQSEMGGPGSIFHFTVCFKPKRGLTEKAVPGKPEKLRDLPVLVIEDNVVYIRIIKEMLAKWHVKVVVAENGPSAYASIKQARDAGEPFSLVIIDLDMSEMDGFVLAERIKQNQESSGIPIMMITSAGQRGDSSRCRELGISAYLTKPFETSDLSGAITTVLETSPRDASHFPLVTRHLLRESRESLSVLLAEDSAVNQKLMVRMLEKRGHKVVVANNGKEVLDLVEKGPFDLVLMDVQMPVMDGFEATVAIREKERETGNHLPVIALTAHAMEGDRENCLEAGMDGYVAKPVNSGKLFEIIEHLDSVVSDTETKPQAPLDSEEKKVIDMGEALSRLDGDEELLKELFEIFLGDAPHRMEELEKALKAEDTELVERQAHTLKGAAANIGAGPMKDEAFRIEMAARKGDLKKARTLYERLVHELERLKGELKGEKFSN